MDKHRYLVVLLARFRERLIGLTVNGAVLKVVLTTLR